MKHCVFNELNSIHFNRTECERKKRLYSQAGYTNRTVCYCSSVAHTTDTALYRNWLHFEAIFLFLFCLLFPKWLCGAYVRSLSCVPMLNILLIHTQPVTHAHAHIVHICYRKHSIEINGRPMVWYDHIHWSACSCLYCFCVCVCFAFIIFDNKIRLLVEHGGRVDIKWHYACCLHLKLYCVCALLCSGANLYEFMTYAINVHTER